MIGKQRFSSAWEVQYSFTQHQQNSVYGNTLFEAEEKIGFLQALWQKESGKNNWLAGFSQRYNWYDDSTPATQNNQKTQPNQYWLPGVFLENEISIKENHKFLLGLRLDHHPDHGVISTPRVGYKINFTPQTLLRFNIGTGFRVVNIFTEDHAALTGARDLIIEEELAPEQSYNININFYKKFYSTSGWIFSLETAAWHTNFSNQILPDYDTNPNEIRYANLEGKAVSQGLSANLEAIYGKFRAILGTSLLDVFTEENKLRTRPVFTEKWSATWAITLPLFFENFQLDYTGNLYGPMRLPLLGADDPRAEFSPVWSLQNVKLSFKKNNNIAFFAGVKNLLNWTPAKNNPFLIARANDPFERDATESLPFDPTYIYAPNQGRRIFVGLNYTLSP